MKLPVINKTTKPFYPRNNKCPICGTKTGEPNSFLVVNGGAMMQVEEGLFEMSNDLSGFLDISFHGAHDRGKGQYRDKFVSAEIVKNSKQGQFDLYFCSTVCFRKFITEIIDDMETELNKEDKKVKKK